MFQKIIIGCFFVFFLSCSKDTFREQDTLVPELEQRLDVSTFPDPSFTSTPGNFQIISGQGNDGNGVIVFNIDNNIFWAFDLTCPVDPDECGAMEVDVLSGEMTCDEDCTDGSAATQFIPSVILNKDTEDETTYNLRRYNAFLEGNVVRITNF